MRFVHLKEIIWYFEKNLNFAKTNKDTLCLHNIGGNCMNVLFHPIRALPLHPIGHMTVHIQRKSGRGMAQVGLHGFYIISY